MAAPTPQLDLKVQAWEGARAILQESFALHAGDHVALFHDEQGVALANLFGEVARSLRLRYTARFVSRERQSTWAGDELTIEDLTLLESAGAVLICLTGDLPASAFRRRLAERAAVDERVAGLLPPSLPALAEAGRRKEAPHGVETAEELALILLSGHEAELTTAVLDARGDTIEEHCLTVTLGGMVRPPATAGGAIQAGTWVPLPWPEVAVAPLEGTASGVFVLNGAFPGGTFAGHEHLLLVFASGRLEMVGGNSQRVGDFWKVVESAKALGTPPLSLGALGVRLTASQTLIQLVLGDNTALGGTLISPLQETLLSRFGSLRVDGHPVLRNGRPAYHLEHWQESWASAARQARDYRPDALIRRTSTRAAVESNGRLRVMRTVARQRSCTYQLGDPELSTRLGDLHQWLEERSGPVKLAALQHLCQPGAFASSSAELQALLGVLERHGLIEIGA